MDSMMRIRTSCAIDLPQVGILSVACWERSTLSVSAASSLPCAEANPTGAGTDVSTATRFSPRLVVPASRFCSSSTSFPTCCSACPGKMKGCCFYIVEIDEAIFGEYHPTVAIRLNNLATLLQATHRSQEAEPLMRRSLEIDEASFTCTCSSSTVSAVRRRTGPFPLRPCPHTSQTPRRLLHALAIRVIRALKVKVVRQGNTFASCCSAGEMVP